jgi:hypothetical protein
MRGFKKVPQPVSRSSAILRLKDTSNGPDLLLLQNKTSIKESEGSRRKKQRTKLVQPLTLLSAAAEVQVVEGGSSRVQKS